VILALVLAGGIWARGRHVRMSGGVAAPPDVTRADVAVDVGDVRLTLSIAPRPPVAFTPIRIRVRAEMLAGRDGQEPRATGPAPALRLASLESARISFEMAMPMGEHRYTFGPREGGWHSAEVVLPMCASGDSRWYALVEGTVGGRTVAARFRLDLARSGPAS
jgi:hypothetical protein